MKTIKDRNRYFVLKYGYFVLALILIIFIGYGVATIIKNPTSSATLGQSVSLHKSTKASASSINVYLYHEGKYIGKGKSHYSSYIFPHKYTIKLRANHRSQPTPIPSPIPRPTVAPTPNFNGSCSTGGDCTAYQLALINQERAGHGIAPLAIDIQESNGTTTCPGSYGHSVHMASTGQLAHDQFPADICASFFTTAGENIGESGGSVQSAVKGIFDQMIAEPYTPGCSSNHHCNIDQANYTRIGIGIYTSNGTTWITEDFIS